HPPSPRRKGSRAETALPTQTLRPPLVAYRKHTRGYCSRRAIPKRETQSAFQLANWRQPPHRVQVRQALDGAPDVIRQGCRPPLFLQFDEVSAQRATCGSGQGRRNMAVNHAEQVLETVFGGNPLEDV